MRCDGGSGGLLKLKWLLKATVSGLVCVVMGCGSPKTETSGGVPIPEPPTPPGQGGGLSVPPPSVDSRLPQDFLSRSFPIRVTNTATHPGMQLIFGIIIPPVVGDPVGAIKMTIDRLTGISGSFFIGVEDALGFTWGILQIFPGTGGFSGSSGRFVAADVDVAVGVAFTLSGGAVSGSIRYRANENHCRRIVTYCQWPSQCRETVTYTTAECEQHLVGASILGTWESTWDKLIQSGS